MIKSKLQPIWKNRLVKNVLVVASGTVGAQAIGMAFIPFITRTYGPEVYGTLGAFIALTAVLTTLATLAYPIAIVLPENDNKAKALVKLSLLITVIMSLFVLVVLLLAGDWIIPKLGAASLISFMFFIPLVMFFSSCQDIAQQWLIRKKAFKGIAKVSIAHSFINYGSQALAGLYAPLAGVLIGIHTLAIAVRSVLTGYIGSKVTTTSVTENQESVSLKNVAYEYRDFPLYRMPQVVLNAASQSLPILMLTAFFGPASAGFYTLTRTVLSLPSTLLASSVQSVFYPHFNEAVLAKDKTLPLLVKATAALTIIGIWPFLIVIVFGPLLFDFVFGQEWQTAGQYAQWLSVWLFFALINRPSVSSIPVFRMQRWFLVYEVVSVCLRIVAIYIGFFYFASALTAVAVFSIVGAVLNIYLIVSTFFAAKRFDQEQIAI
ncbi:lipopolysaccharide biosynthesis protein [Psychrobacter sp. CLB018]|uniref:lipopolysaccharide biosynthesis protein n=1 Tax=Psychrobacter sp. CLB018 TaxID=3240930 RepID=UPI00351191F2